MKYVVVSGGVVSGLGKGVTASSIGLILKSCGFRVTAIKIGLSLFLITTILSRKTNMSPSCSLTQSSFLFFSFTFFLLLVIFPHNKTEKRKKKVSDLISWPQRTWKGSLFFSTFSRVQTKFWKKKSWIFQDFNLFYFHC